MQNTHSTPRFEQQRQNELRKIRLVNLIALLDKHQMTQAEFARRIGVSASAIGQYTTGHRALGRAFCSRIETELGLPAGCMDFPGMAPAPGECLPAVEEPTKQQKPNGRPEAPIHAAVVDAFWATVRSGAMSDADCAGLLVQLIGMRSRKGGASQAPALVDAASLLARLRLRDVVLVHTGQEGREGLERGLLEDFGPEVAQSVLRHVYELSEAPLGARTAPESQRGVIRGAGGLPGGPEQPERY
ncbi:Helix-turn-helix [Paenacidovorax caeni]|uniref:Helix-turn-helix n=1 Tax=Paenacidovorax caeni TaxID=343013 RepID=A0A1I7KL28_9BURK|nr:helix-turn-helix transcriptional regulator [Paenacidovorax caeni]SFU98162.1 Helix-turn-helix [Paenacidovorax caeni]